MKILLKRFKERINWLPTIAIYIILTTCNIVDGFNWGFQTGATIFILLFISVTVFPDDKIYSEHMECEQIKSKDAEPKEIRILLDEEDFNKLTAGDVLEKNNIKIALQDIGYVQMQNIIDDHIEKM